MSRYRKTMADAYAEVAEHKGTEPHEHPHEPTDPDVPDSGTDSEWEEVDLVEEVSAKEFDALKKGNTLKIKYKSSMSSGEDTFVVKSRSRSKKYNVDKVTLQSKSRPGSVKFYLYKRANKVSLALGDMGASLVSMVKEVAPPGWGHTKAEKEKTKPDKPKSKIGGTAHEFQKDLDSGKFKGLPGDKTYKDKKASMFKLMWSMKNKGDKPHYKPGVKDKLKKKYKGPEGQNEEKEETRLFVNVPNSVVKKANKEADKVKKQLEKEVLGKSTQNTSSGADVTSKNDVYEGSNKAKKARKFKVSTPGQDRTYEKLSAERMFKAYEAAFSVPNDAGGWPTGDTPPVPDEAYQKATTKNKMRTKKHFAQAWTNAVAKKRVQKEEVEIQVREGKEDWDLIMKNARAYWNMKNAKHFVDNMPSLTSQQKKDAMKAAKKWLR